ncbi:ribosome small subunit-dependent GTPase A [Schleiferilactobacillus shenzhenensis]|uniref:Small ribosomal subunit biogenesis GTPase RsgA n=1 Tax=Schleiferilactobacillus shenzhenensis LY-73 TaxID=1231336 RepID=U4TJF3_9LACO|nr:ribosome small subunit-dependent GTPase A [Schleiferilactobacillus shenzhenensis]ERL64951.1 RsgA [Schleiferilactobacillus shenzhenensis LY-73]
MTDLLTDYGLTEQIRHTVPLTDTAKQLARVIGEQKELYQVMTAAGPKRAEITGKLRFNAVSRADFPAVGDWVVCRAMANGPVLIEQVVPRFSQFTRKMAGLTTDAQVVAANVDTVFIVMAMNHDFNLRRLERYVTVAYDSGASPVVVLTKSDLTDRAADQIAQVEDTAVGVPVHAVSALTDSGKEEITPYFAPGRTVVLLGSSGAGKSTLANWLLGEAVQAVNGIRATDDHGKHTTTSREILQLPGGGLLMDTPGMRELQLWDTDESAMAQTFQDIEALAAQCRFRDCTHTHEPGCAVQAAIAAGSLPAKRLISYRKLQRENAFLAKQTAQRSKTLAHRANKRRYEG